MLPVSVLLIRSRCRPEIARPALHATNARRAFAVEGIWTAPTVAAFQRAMRDSPTSIGNAWRAVRTPGWTTPRLAGSADTCAGVRQTNATTTLPCYAPEDSTSASASWPSHDARAAPSSEHSNAVPRTQGTRYRVPSQRIQVPQNRPTYREPPACVCVRARGLSRWRPRPSAP